MSIANPPAGGEPNAGISVADGTLRPNQYALLRPSDPSLPIETLRERFKEDNYLFLKGLLPRDHAIKARESYFKFISPSKVLKPGTDYSKGIFDPNNDLANFGGLSSKELDSQGKSNQAVMFTKLINEAHVEKWYTEDFCQHPNLSNFIKKLTEWSDVQQFQRSLFRCNLPGTQPIGVHYDQIFLRQGDVTNITAWCAMGDIKLNGGGLMYLEKSASIGRDFESDFSRRAKEAGMSEEEAQNAYNQNMIKEGGISTKPLEFATEHDRRWLVAEFEAGDVVLHDPFTIHASTVNTDADSVIRLSTDLRFYDATRPYDRRWLHHFYPGDDL